MKSIAEIFDNSKDVLMYFQILWINILDLRLLRKFGDYQNR